MDVILQAFNIATLASVFFGTFLGVVIGMLPGLNGPIGVALLLPFTFSMDVGNGLLLLGGLYMGSSYGGSISAILLNAPGTEVAAATALEGYPMMQKGQGEEALHYSLIASTLGGLFGALAMIFCTPVLARVALRFGPPEMALLAASGLAIIGMLSGKDIWLGLATGAFGVLLSTIGQDIMLGQLRNTFGVVEMEGGVALVPVLVGFFAVSEIIVQLLRPNAATLNEFPAQPSVFSQVFRDIFTKFGKALTKGSLIGILIGIMPGAGAAIATFIAYGEAKRGSKHPELYGKGYAEGIVAAESANNSAVCGSLVPLLALGIPGSTTCAIMYGALTLHGIIPGPRLMQTSADLVHVLMVGMMLSVVFMLIIGRSGMKLFTLALKVPLRILMPCILVLCFIGSFSINNSMFDIGLTVLFGLAGYFFKIARIPVAPAVLGLILGPIAEEGIRQSMLMAKAQDIGLLHYLIGRPISLVLCGVLVAICYASFASFKKTCAMGGNVEEC
jgi:putative tricarboxylic transport membrane protein